MLDQLKMAVEGMRIFIADNRLLELKHSQS